MEDAIASDMFSMSGYIKQIPGLLKKSTVIFGFVGAFGLINVISELYSS